jgi:Zn-dependent protease with chaperone function
LVKIVASTGRLKRYRSGTGNLNAFKALFIEDPDSAERDQMAMANTRMFKTDQQLVQEIISRRISTADRLIELLSTHPNIVKRLQALQSLS